MDQEMSSAKQCGSPCKENEGNAAKPCGQDSQGSQRPALQENAFQPLLTPGGPLALSPPRTLRSSQKWGSLSASRILGLSPNGRPRGRSLVLSPMCSRAAPASQGHQHQAGVAGVLPGVHMQDSSSLDFVPPRAARAVPPLGRMCHSQPTPLSSPWPAQGEGIPDSRGTPDKTGEPSELDRAPGGSLMGILPDAAAAGAQAAAEEVDIYAQASPNKQQATRSHAPNSAAPEAGEQPDGDMRQLNALVGDAAQQLAETSMSIETPGKREKDEDANARVGLEEMGGTPGDGPSLQLNLSLSSSSQDDSIMPAEVEPKGIEMTARQLVAPERRLIGGFCPDTQVEDAQQACAPQMQVPVPVASFVAGPAVQQPPLCPDTQLLECPSATPAQAQPSPSGAPPAAPGAQRAPHEFSGALLAPNAGATAYLLTEVQPTAVAAAEVEARAEAAQPSVAAAHAAIHTPAQENREASPPQLNADAVHVASKPAASAVMQKRRSSAEEKPPGLVGIPARSTGVQPSERVISSGLLDVPKRSTPAVEVPSPLRTPPSGRPSLSLTLLSEDFVSESEGTQRAVQAADIIDRYNYKCLLGDAVGGIFSSVLAADMEAIAAGAGRKVSRTVSPETTRWERRLVEAWKDHELLGWDVDGPGDPQTPGGPDGLTQEVVAMLCAEEEINSRREELERSGELKAVRAVRDYVQVGATAAPEVPRPACGAQPNAALESGRQFNCLAATAVGAGQITAESSGGQQLECSLRREHPAAAEGTMVGNDANRLFSAGVVEESGAVVTEALDEVAAVMEALVAAASACPSDQAAEPAAGQGLIPAKSLSDQATGMPAPEEEPALPDADCAPMEIDSGNGGSACAAMQPEGATLEPAAAAIDRAAIDAPAPVHGRVASIAADEDDEDGPSLQLNLQLETQYPEQQAVTANFPELVPDSEAAYTGANCTALEPAPLSNVGNAEQRDPPPSQSGPSCAAVLAGYPSSAKQRGPPVLATGPAHGPLPVSSAQLEGTPASAGTLGGAVTGSAGAAGPSHHLVPDSEAAGHSPRAAGALSEPVPVSTSGSGQQGGRPALEGRAPAARSQDVWGAILSTSPRCGAAPTHRTPPWQPRSGPSLGAGGWQLNQSQPSPGARGWQREVGSSGLRLRPVWGSVPASREATPLSGDTLLTPPKRTLLGPPSGSLARPPADSASSPDTPSDVAATADVLHLYSRPLHKDIQTPESQRKRPRALASESPRDMAARHQAACGKPKAGARVDRASPASPDPSGSFVPDTYPGVGAGCGALDEHADHGDAGGEPVGVQEEEFNNVLPMGNEVEVQPPKRRRLSLEGGKTHQIGKDRQGEPVRPLERDSCKKGLHAMAVHARCGRRNGAMPMTRARADELASDERPRMTRLQEQKLKRKAEQLKAGRLHRAGQVRPISARKRRTSGVALERQPALPSHKRKREAAPRSDAPLAGKHADSGQEGPAAGKHAAATEHAQEACAAGHATRARDDLSKAGRIVDDQSMVGAAALQAAGGNVPPGRVRDPYSFPESQDVRLENPARGRTGLATAAGHLHISRRSHAQAQASHVEGLAGSNLHHGAGRDGAWATRNASKAEQSHGPDAPQHSGDTAEANHDRWAPQGRRARLAAGRAVAGAAGAAADRPQRAKRQPLRFEDYQQGSIPVQDTAEVRLCAPHGGGGRKGAGPPQTHGGQKAMEEAAEKAAGPPRRCLVRLSDLDMRHADNAAADAAPEERGGTRATSGPADVEADGCDDDAGRVAEADTAHGQEGTPLGEEEPVEGAPNLRAQEREDGPRPALKHPKLGCSKCRYSGKGCGTCRAKAGAAGPLSASPKRISGPRNTRRASLPDEAPDPQPKSTRRAPLPDEAPEPHQDITAAAGRRQFAGRRKSEPALFHNAKAGALAGKAFLVTGFEDDNLRRHMHNFICKNGGSVIDSIPPPEDQRVVHGVLAGRACDRRAKYLFAHVTGAPALKAYHLDRCVTAGEWLQPRAADAWLRARKPCQVFHGYRMYLHGEKGFQQQFGALLPHAGAIVMAEMETTRDSLAPERRRLSLASSVSQAACDLVIADKADPLHTHPDLQNLMRQARRMAVPVKSVDWMIAALVSGQLPDPIPLPAPSEEPISAPEPEAAGNSSPGKEAAAAQDAAPLAEAAEDGNGGLVEDSESFGEPPFEIRPSFASVSFGGPAAAGPRSPQRAAEGHQPDRPVQQLDHLAAMSGRQPAGQGQLRWVGEPSKDPPTGLSMHAAHHRNFYSAVAKGDAVVEVGDDVVVEVLGEREPRVARLEALWSERPVDNCERMLARCRLYYRPSETSFMSSGKPHELFASDHVEQRLPASTLLQKCTVVCGHPAGMAAILDRCTSLGGHTFFCLYQYDHLGEALKPVPAG